MFPTFFGIPDIHVGQMFSLSGQGWLYSVPKTYLHISPRQAINSNYGNIYNHLYK